MIVTGGIVKYLLIIRMFEIDVGNMDTIYAAIPYLLCQPIG